MSTGIEAVPEGKGPLLGCVPSVCEPAAVNIPKRSAPHLLVGGLASFNPVGLADCDGHPVGPNQGGQDAQENNGSKGPETGKVFLPVEASFEESENKVGLVSDTRNGSRLNRLCQTSNTQVRC